MHYSRKSTYEGVPASLYKMLTLVENYKAGTDMITDFQKELFKDHLEIKNALLSVDEKEFNTCRLLAVETMEDMLRTEGNPNLRKFLADNPESLSESDKSKLLNLLDYRDQMIKEFKTKASIDQDKSDVLLVVPILEDGFRMKGIPNFRKFVADNPKCYSESDKSKMLELFDYRDQIIAEFIIRIVSVSSQLSASDTLLALAIMENMLRTKGIPNLRTFLADYPEGLSESDESKLLELVDHRDRMIVIFKVLSKYKIGSRKDDWFRDRIPNLKR
ncbi:uncharacterized protein LOC135844836 isoform X2 [Planococcus citri]